MRFTFGFAGIPAGEVYDRIYRKRDTLIGDNADFIGKGLTNAAVGQEYITYFLSSFKKTLVEDIRKQQFDTAFVIIYVRQNENQFKHFEQAFFPTILMYPIDWQLTGKNFPERRSSINKLYQLLDESVKKSRKILRALRKEVNDYQNRTPLLLPIRNFCSKGLQNELWRLQQSLIEQQNATDVITEHKKRIHRAHPLQKQASSLSRVRCYMDEKNIEFHPPGNAHHGIHHPTSGHPERCLIGGYKRFGAPYKPGFHYDCIKGKFSLREKLYSCHSSGQEIVKGHPHINIAVNDFVRR